ncbi:MAG: hypothetical protein WBD40_22965 [Tepidisphaeraceae bacterium]
MVHEIFHTASDGFEGQDGDGHPFEPDNFPNIPNFPITNTIMRVGAPALEDYFTNEEVAWLRDVETW